MSKLEIPFYLFILSFHNLVNVNFLLGLTDGHLKGIAKIFSLTADRYRYVNGSLFFEIKLQHFLLGDFCGCSY